MISELSLDELEIQLARADAAYADAQWRGHFGRVAAGELARLEAARSTLLLDRATWEALRCWQASARDGALDRRLELLARRWQWAAIESRPQVYELRNRIDRLASAFPLVNSRTRLARVLRHHPSRARRREAWLALEHLAAQVEDDVRQLLRRREALARELGATGFVSWALEAVGLNRPGVEAFFDKLVCLTDAPYRAWLADSARRLSLAGGLRPWDLAFAAEGAVSALPTRAFSGARWLPEALAVADGLGLGQAALGVRVDTADMPYAGLCYAVRPPDDVRVLFNPRGGHAGYSALFHELGHALHWRCLRPCSPVLRRESPPFAEAMACLWERLAWEADWLAGRAPSAQSETWRRAWAGRTLYRLRLFMAQAAFEYRAYPALDGDLKELWREVYQSYLGVPCERAPGWANSPFWTSHPVYLQNYVIAEAIASQSVAALRRRLGRLIGEPRVGEWLVEHYYGPGAALPWRHKVLQATGAPLSGRDLAAELSQPCEGF